jgi:hypothetical protein
MDTVLGVSVTTTTVRMVLIEGEKADGVIIECATFDTSGGDIKASPHEQISAAIRATQQSALSMGHHLVVSGVAWDDDPTPGSFRDGISARDLQNVMLVAERHATGALAQNIGRALGFDTTAVMVIGPQTATLSVVDSNDGSLVEARMCTVNGDHVSDVLPAMAATLESTNPKPGSVFVVGPRPVVTSVKSSLERLISQPVIVPEEPEFALARGAALAAASVPGSEASTCGLAYSQDPDEVAVLGRAPVKLADAETQVALFDSIRNDDVGPSPQREANSKARIPIGSIAAAILVVGAVTLAMSVAGNVRTAIDRDSVPAGAAEVSGPAPELPVAQAAVPAPADPQSVPVATPVALPPPAPPLPAPAVPAPAVPAPEPVVQVRRPAPQRVIAQPAPVVVEKALPAPAPVVVEPEAPEALPEPVAVVAPPPAVSLPPLPPASLPSPVINAPAINPAAPGPPSSSSPWTPPWLRIGTPPSQQQAAQPLPGRQWLPNPSGPQQEVGQWPQQASPGLQIVLWPRQQSAPQWTPQVPQWTPQIPRPAAQVPQWTPALTPRPAAQVPQWTPALTPQWTPAPLAPQWIPAPSVQAPQSPATTRSPYTYPNPNLILPGLLNPAGADNAVPQY